MQTYIVCSDSTLTSEATARGHVFANANFASGQSGSTTTGISSATLQLELSQLPIHYILELWVFKTILIILILLPVVSH